MYSNAAGDTYDFTTYLSRVDATWRSKLGFGDTVAFPTGLAANGNSGATALLESNNGAIAYVGVAYLISHRLPAAAIEDAAGRYEYPEPEQHRGRGRQRYHGAGGRRRQIVYPPRRGAHAAYPISTFSYAIVSTAAGAATRAALRDWILYAIGAGQSFGENLDFAPLPSIRDQGRQGRRPRLRALTRR